MQHPKVQACFVKLTRLLFPLQTPPVQINPLASMDSLTSIHVKLLAVDLQTLTIRPSPSSSSSSSVTVTRNRRPIALAETLGIIVSLDRTEKFLKFLVDDGTGCIPCILWLNHRQLLENFPHLRDKEIGMEAKAEVAGKQAELARLGELVRVRGSVGVYRGAVQITVRDLVVERDSNAEVLHWLQCVKLARVCYDVRKMGS